MAHSIKGRGAADNPRVRFDAWRRERDESGIDESLVAPKTVVIMRDAASIVSRNDSPDVPFAQSVNPYQGCEHGCVYCYARPSHAYLGLSPGLDFETRIFGKRNAAELLRQELARPGYQCKTISLGANTDPYQPAEREHRVTRSVLEVLSECRHPVGIVTKSSLVERDMDLLAAMAIQGLVRVFVSITTLSADLARKLEPRASAPYRRLEMLRRLRAAGVPCGVLVAPVIPFVTDDDMEAVLDAAADAGARAAAYVILRLPHEVKGLFEDWLRRHLPLKAHRVMQRVRDMRNGRENDARFANRMTGTGEFARLIARRFSLACNRYGLDARGGHELDESRFIRPSINAQLTLW